MLNTRATGKKTKTGEQDAVYAAAPTEKTQSHFLAIRVSGSTSIGAAAVREEQDEAARVVTGSTAPCNAQL